ncbi:MAG: Rnf-Nqr domain containing protein [Oscillospiraceae bacterium]|nr:Rnf-Nqr domain containing protein [Oscillospiraceae bacterium]
MDDRRKKKKRQSAEPRKKDAKLLKRAAKREERAEKLKNIKDARKSGRFERRGLSLSLEEAARRDLIFLNNPVLVQGLALTPLVVAASTLRNALVLALMGFLLITPVRLLGDILARRAPGRMRALVYALISGAVYIPALFVVNLVFGAGAVGAGIYLPVLAVDGIVLSRAEIPLREGPLRALENGLKTSLGYALALLFTGALRGLLGEGRLLGSGVLAAAPLPISSTVAGGFIFAALLAAAVQLAAAAYLKERKGGEEP